MYEANPIAMIVEQAGGAAVAVTDDGNHADPRHPAHRHPPAHQRRHGIARRGRCGAPPPAAAASNMTPSAPRPGLAVAVVAAVLLSAAWPEAQGALSWTYAASDHFEVYTTSGGGRAREALAHYEGVHAFFTRHLKLSPGRLPVARLIVFSSEHEFAPYRPNEFATAFYQSGPSGDAIVMRSLDRDSATTVVHEYAHLMFRRSGAAYPLWLNEGLADYFSTVSIDRGRATLGIPPLGRLRPLAARGGAAPTPSSVCDRSLRDRVQLPRACGPVLFTELGADAHAAE